MEWLKDLVEWSQNTIGGGSILWYIIWIYLMLCGVCGGILGIAYVIDNENTSSTGYSKHYTKR